MVLADGAAFDRTAVGVLPAVLVVSPDKRVWFIANGRTSTAKLTEWLASREARKWISD
jgi:hypothetical protein